MKVLAINVNGDITYCTCPPELRGTGRCNHIDHQHPNETPAEFVARVAEVQKKVEEHEASDDVLDEAFIPLKGTTVETKPYRMTDEEKEELVQIENKMQLDQNIEGGYIHLETPLWNDMDKNYYSQLSGMTKKEIESVIHGEGYLVMESENPRYREGLVIPAELVDKWNDPKSEETYPDNFVDKVQIKTGVEAMNEYAKKNGDFEATSDVYVLPYYMRIGSDVTDHDLTVGYKYLLRTWKDPDKQQVAYDALLNNNALDKWKARYQNGYRNKSLADEFVGKGGVFRACLSGSSVPYVGRAVISPNSDLKYGEIAIPPSMAVDIFKPTLLKQLYSEGYDMESVDAWMHKFRVPQTDVKPEDRLELEARLQRQRVIGNRAPSLHTASLQSFRPRISDNATIQIHPLYCDNYGADFDGDTWLVSAVNHESMVKIVDRSIDAKLKINTQKPRSQSSSGIMPSKDALWGLLNILDRRSK